MFGLSAVSFPMLATRARTTPLSIAWLLRFGSSVSRFRFWRAAMAKWWMGTCGSRRHKKLGLKQVPVILCDEWTPAQVKAFRLMVNRSVTWAEWDEDLLSLELLELKDLDFDLGLTGFDGRELDALMHDPTADEQADQAPPLPEVAVTQPGDLVASGAA